MICKIDHKKLKESNFKKHGIKILSFLKNIYKTSYDENKYLTLT